MNVILIVLAFVVAPGVDGGSAVTHFEVPFSTNENCQQARLTLFEGNQGVQQTLKVASKYRDVPLVLLNANCVKK